LPEQDHPSISFDSTMLEIHLPTEALLICNILLAVRLGTLYVKSSLDEVAHEKRTKTPTTSCHGIA
jgi:hypothetical protein